MSEYTVNGSAMSLAPATVTWTPQPILLDHNRQTLYSNFFTVTHVFPESNGEQARQWIDAVSSGSVNLRTLNKWSTTSFIILSAVYIEMTQLPVVEDIHFSSFTLTVTNALGLGVELI